MTANQTKPRRGCLVYVLIVVSILGLVLIAGALVGMRYANRMLREFTADTPEALPAVQITPAEAQQLQQRVARFRDALRRGAPTPELALTADEMNGLIATDPQFSALRGKVFFQMEGDRLQGRISAPLDQLNLPIFRGRYLNAKVTFDVSLNNGVLRVSPQDVQVKGQPLPRVYLDTLRKQNLAESFTADSSASEWLGKLEAVRFQEGRLVIVPQNRPAN
ncbi:MAG TPA: hypothetical protein P5038_20585 [Candidatus Paceibacterota bacterium]|nr:hypothetical protein [Candidatus Paceibacterota bacterium]